MDTDKLLKAIRILIKEEIKSNLPKLVKEVVKSEVNKKSKIIERKVNKKLKSSLKEMKSTPKKSTVETEIDPFDLAEQKLQESRNQVNQQPQQNQNQQPTQQFNTKYKGINDVLNETAKNYTPGSLNSMNQNVSNPQHQIPMESQQPQQPQQTQGQQMNENNDRTMSFDSSDVHGIAAKSQGGINRQEMAAKMGYGNMGGGGTTSIPTTTASGRQVNASDPSIDPVKKAMGRDYRELVKRFKK